ncbi:MAG: tetratricopeptide repeat protein, partial [Alistipes sp.]|nr:tetratricopeptide repeat protein [Alistipes sp.]
MKRYIKVLPFVAAFIVCSCDDSRLQTELDRAEAVILEHPDSALSILSRTSATGSNKQNARRALLYSMALDKNYIDVCSDSLVTVARDYYRNHGSVRDRFLSEFYYASYLRNCNDLQGALCIYSDCEELGIESGDHYHLGVLYTQIANVYEQQFDYDNAVLYDRLALEQYRLGNAPSAQGFISAGLGKSLFALERFDEASANYHNALAIFEELHDTDNIDYTLCGLACNHLYNGQLDSAEMAINRITAEYGFHEYITLADIYRRRNLPNEARAYLAKAKEHVYSARSRANALLYESRIDMQQGYYKEAAEHMIQCNKISDSLVNVALSRPAASVHRDHFQELYRQASVNSDLLRQRFWLSITLLVVIAGIVIYYIIYVM